MAEPLKVGEWRTYKGFNETIYYFKILSTKTEPNNAVGFRLHKSKGITPNEWYYFDFNATSISLITLNDILLIPFPLVVTLRLQIKEILEWLSQELRHPQGDLFV